jgi:hypothetical protein
VTIEQAIDLLERIKSIEPHQTWCVVSGENRLGQDCDCMMRDLWTEYAQLRAVQEADEHE